MNEPDFISYYLGVGDRADVNRTKVVAGNGYFLALQVVKDHKTRIETRSGSLAVEVWG